MIRESVGLFCCCIALGSQLHKELYSWKKKKKTPYGSTASTGVCRNSLRNSLNRMDYSIICTNKAAELPYPGVHYH